ncbi:MAG: serine hydrolase [Alphaproteobacteria bacterium]|nr:serine hydrolase [Alphaproteobacteria bacterium]
MRISRIFLPFLVLAGSPAWAQPEASAVAPPLQRLEQRLAATASDNPGEFGIAAMDLATGEAVSVNGDKAFPMASTVKVAVAATYLGEVDAGRRTLADPVAGTTASALMERMIIHSDNRATDLLIATLGGPTSVDVWLHAHGLAGIRVDRTIAQLLAARRDLRDVRDSSTPKAMIDLLRLVDGGSALKPESRAVLLDLMRRCATGRNRIRALLPPGTLVEHKTGTLNGFTGDVAFVTLPDGRRIAMAMFARGGDNRPGVIATVARAIYDGFAGQATASAAAAGGTVGSDR